MLGNVKSEQLSAWQRSLPTKRDGNLRGINTPTFTTAEDRVHAGCKLSWNDDPVISPEATSALVEPASSKKPHLTFLEHSASIHHPLQEPSSKPPTRPRCVYLSPSTSTRNL
ncbi:hypothetical protein NQZ68_017355 [Dissostichus eleginoides]|nr:hypothetical protein NQZ68_017355 [Dissostichus eleginoides]